MVERETKFLLFLNLSQLNILRTWLKWVDIGALVTVQEYAGLLAESNMNHEGRVSGFA